jgi:hypothetical protein
MSRASASIYSPDANNRISAAHQKKYARLAADSARLGSKESFSRLRMPRAALSPISTLVDAYVVTHQIKGSDAYFRGFSIYITVIN